MTTPRIKGVLTPVVTPFHSNGAINVPLFIRQCQWLQDNHIGLAVFGTNSEANSLSPQERMEMLDALIEAGLAPARMMPGTGACDLPTAVQLTRKAVAHQCGGVLALPPFYYKGVSDDGLFRFFAELIEQVGDDALRVYLYHIPPVAQVGFSVELVERLLKAYPKNIAGMKDSTGDIAHTQTMLKHFAADGFDVFAGTETILLDTLRAGGAGCISATANVNAPAIHDLCQTWQQDDAPAKQQAMNDLRAIFQKYPMIPALKAAVAHWSGEDSWRHVRAPLVALDDAQAHALIQTLEEAGFSIEGLKS
ncbi:dihydrodipicolinate synthase family protein [Lampropedia puyangensis]|uniref:Dihydrodipicolinate synthase family protein n=1 Tax=Lampropedia puyangensis TaxID=1330072 RepID=A0A4V4GSB0_9BURK|nr:dihydrodipicolinate synthase family protein [Lampropedia puyangensis]THU05056.1 dihydrodipicolinate synthase family protein [Lampropedia puyangensis]